MNINTTEEILQENSDEEIIRERSEKIEEKCREEAEKQRSKLSTGFYLDEIGLYYQEATKDDAVPTKLRICSRLEITAITRNQHGEEFGRLLHWHDCDGKPHTFAMPMSLLAGDGTVYRSVLLSKGLEIEPGKAVCQKLTTYIQSSHPKTRALCTPQIGWHDNCFILPSQTIGRSTNEQIIFQSGHVNGNFSSRGNLEEWQQLAKLSEGNSRLVLALSMAFAAPLLTPLGVEGGGIHFHGISSLGKSTIARVAASCWGDKNYFVTWRATTNGLEGIALTHNDTLLCLDELSQSDPDKIGEAIYMLANGSGKIRSDALGFSKPPSNWRILFLSSGETNLADHMQQAGRKPRAGQEVRILNIPADTEKYGAFEHLHGHPTGEAFANALKELFSKYYGTAAIRFIELFIANKAEYLKMAREKMRQFKQECLPINAQGQVTRSLDRFAVIAAAGEIATVMGITQWETGEAFSGVKACFEDWLHARGSVGCMEIDQIKAHIRNFFELYGESRFADLASFTPDAHDPNITQTPHQKIVNRAGFRECKGDKTTYYVFPEVFKSELCAGYDKKLVERVCREAGWLIPGNERIQLKKRLPQMGSKSVYAFSNKVLGDEA
ncbi:MAG: DUF927 domain-containing protein [Chlamydiales bacterium]|nr:DUF927 domain-containing protein [Chlamydiales bacterium]